MENNELQALARDIAQNGQREPILRYQGEILDGRNRFAACLLAKVEPTIEDFEGTEDAALHAVISLNVHRRHLDESQRAMVGARLARLPEGRPSKETPPIGGVALSAEKASETLNVSTRSIERARIVLEDGDADLIAKVDSGEVKVSTAANQIRPPATKRGRPLAGKADEAVKALQELWRKYKAQRDALIPYMKYYIEQHDDGDKGDEET